MVDLYPVLPMAASPDPFHHELQQERRTATPNPNPNLNRISWGTWEELLLASAVRKHGSDNWAMVSSELQSRARAGSMAFTPEACRAGYQAIRLRFGVDGSRDCNGSAWYEELRRLRVDRLKWELEQYDNSIGSLENKIKRLQLEKEELARKKSLISEVGAQDPTTTCNSVSASIINDTPDAVSMFHMTEVHKDASNSQNDGPSAKYTDHASSLAEQTRLDGSKSSVEHVRRIIVGPNGVEALDLSYKHAVVDETEVVNEPSLYPGGSSVKAEQAVGAEESSSRAEILPDAINGNQQHEMIDKVSSRPLEQSIGRGAYRLVDSEEMCAKAGGLAVVCQDDVLPHVVKAEERTNMEEGNALDSKDAEGGSVGGRILVESESLSSPIPKSLPIKGRRSFDGGCYNSSLDVDDKRLVFKALEDNGPRGPKRSVLVESGDSTEGKDQEVLAEKLLSKEPSSKEVKLERLEEDMPERVPMGSLAPRKLGATSLGPLNPDKQNHSMSSSENSLLHEVWGESAEVGDKEAKPVTKKRRLAGRERKHTSTTSKVKHHEGVRDAPDYSTRATPPLKVESVTTSHEVSESMHSPGGKDDHTEAWHQAERFSGDSRFEKSEVGSYVDGNEDNSPMSRRTRREPKVLGKHIPLLESLRVVCAHKCAPTFRHIPDMEENHEYHHLIRSPIDLGMIRNKLEEGQYTGSIHFFRDLLLMVSNASVYYPRDVPELAAASGLRECIVKEMGKVFETEALVKQEGPSFRKRDSRQLNQRKREGLKASSSMARSLKEKPAKAPPSIENPAEKPAKNLVLKLSDASTSVDSRGPFHTNPVTQAQADRADLTRKKVHSSDGKRVSDSQSTFTGSHHSKLGPAITEKASEAKHLGSSSKPLNNTVLKDFNKKERLAEDSERERKTNCSSATSTGERRAESTVKAGMTSETHTPVVAPSKGVESSGRKVKAASQRVQEPVKRGVGRPPKHSHQQQQGLQRPRDIEAPTSTTRKRGRR